MGERRRAVGFFAALNSRRLGELLWPEGLPAFVIGVGGATYMLSRTTIADRQALVGDSLTSLGVLLGVVFAAFAVVFSQLSDSYMRLLDKAEGGVVAFFHPFVLAIGCQVSTLFLALAYRGGAAIVPSKLEVGMFLAWAFLFAFSVLDIVALARNITMHGLMRVKLLEAQDHLADGTVRGIRPPKDQQA